MHLYEIRLPQVQNYNPLSM
jgi:hypothetical protein